MAIRTKKRTITIEAKPQTSVLLETPLPLDTAYPAEPQISITITEDMLPVRKGGAADIGIRYGLVLNVTYTKETTGTTYGVYMLPFVNGVQAYTTGSMGIMYSTSLQAVHQISVPIANVGDVVTVKFKNDVAGVVSLNAYTYKVLPRAVCYILVKNKNLLIRNVKVTYMQQFALDAIYTALASVASTDWFFRRPKADSSKSDEGTSVMSMPSADGAIYYNGGVVVSKKDAQYNSLLSISATYYYSKYYTTAVATNRYVGRYYSPANIEIEYSEV